MLSEIFCKKSAIHCEEEHEEFQCIMRPQFFFVLRMIVMMLVVDFQMKVRCRNKTKMGGIIFKGILQKKNELSVAIAVIHSEAYPSTITSFKRINSLTFSGTPASS